MFGKKNWLSCLAQNWLCKYLIEIILISMVDHKLRCMRSFSMMTNFTAWSFFFFLKDILIVLGWGTYYYLLAWEHITIDGIWYKEMFFEMIIKLVGIILLMFLMSLYSGIILTNMLQLMMMSATWKLILVKSRKKRGEGIWINTISLYKRYLFFF